MKKSSKKKFIKKLEISNENFKFVKSNSISKLIFSRPIFLNLKKRFKLWLYELGNGKKVNFNTMWVKA
jgi:hypothetical protein